MKQKLLSSIKLRAMMLVAILCAVFTGSAWADDPIYTLSFPKLTSGSDISSYTASHSNTCSGVSWAVYGNQSIGDYIRVGGKNTTNTNRTLTSGAVLSSTKKIGKVTINHSGTGNGKSSEITVNSIKVEGSTSSDFSSSVISKTISSPSVASSGSLDFVPDEDWAESSYFRITVNYKITGSNNCYLTINSVDFYEATGGGGGSASIVPDETTINAPYTAVDDGTISVTYTGVDPTDGVDIVYYTTSAADVETTRPDWILVDFDASYNLEYVIDANDGAARTAYMKIYGLDGEADDVYSNLITITQAAGLVAPSFSPAAGKVAAGTTITLTQDAADEIRYTTDGTDPTKTTGDVYSTPIVITTATTIKAIAVKGDGVSAVASAAYTINVATPECNLASSGNYLAGTGITLTSAGNTIYYNMTTDGSDPEAPTSTSTEYAGPISLSSGTVKIQAIAYDSYGNTSSVVSRTIKGVNPATLPFNWAGGVKATLTALDGVVGSGLGSDYADSHGAYRVKFDTDGDYIEVFTNAQPLKVSVGVKMIGGDTSSSITVQESTNGVEFTNVENLDISGSQNDVIELETTEDFAATTRVIKLLFVRGANVGVGPIRITKYTVGPDIDVTDPDVELAGDATYGEIEYSIINPDGVSSLSAESEDDWISDITVTATKVTFTTTANTGAERVGHITLSYPNAENKVVTVTQAEKVVTLTYSPAATITSGKHYIITNGTSGTVKAMGAQRDSNRGSVDVTFDGDNITFASNAGVAELIIYGPDADGYYTIYDGTGYLYAASSSANQLKIQTNITDNGRWSITIKGDATIKAQGSNTRNWMRNNGELFSCYSTGQDAVYLYEKAGEATPTESVTVSAAGYATYASDNALDFSGSSINAYIAIADGTTGVTFTKVTKVPANTGVLLYKDGGATESIPSLAGAASDVTGNVFLRGTGAAVASVVDDLHNYILNKPSEKPIGFYKAAGQTVAKNRAYIQIDESTPVKGFIALPGDDATAIESLTPNPSPVSEGSIFNLAGQRMSKLQKGINIVNGKKVLVK